MHGLPITWVLEEITFSDRQVRLTEAARAAGHHVVFWNDDWWTTRKFPTLTGHVVFHGSLGNASRIASEVEWSPGAFCATDRFSCSSWYEDAKQWLIHRTWATTTVTNLVTTPTRYLEQIGAEQSFFVRPDSPLKPFSGRVLDQATLSMAALDFGFYYDDPHLPIIVMPVLEISDEWRLVVSNGKPIAASSYVASRDEVESGCPAHVWQFANEIAETLPAPEAIYVLDICESEGELRLLELNPFSGADLYACDRTAIVQAIASLFIAT